MARAGVKKSQATKDKIKASLLATRAKRETQICKVYELKITNNKLNKAQREALSTVFLEAKWFYNYILSQEDVFDFDPKVKNIIKLDKDKNPIPVDLKYLTSSAKTAVFAKLKQNIVNLSKAKEKGYKVGALKYKKEVNTVPYPQYGTSHRKVSDNLYRIQGIKKPLRVSGLKQIPEEAEFANIELIRKPSGYYIHQTVWLPKESRIETGKTVGLDFGIKTHITTSDGDMFNVTVGETERLKRLQRKLSKQRKHSNNYNKTRQKLRREYEKMSARKRDKANKIVSELLAKYDIIAIQDENIKGWQSGLFGKQVQHGALGLIISQLKRHEDRVIVVDRYFPSTKLCPKCGKLNTLSLSDRTYKCSCGYEEDRDIKAAKLIKKVAMERSEVTPVESQKLILDSVQLADDNKKPGASKQEAVKSPVSR